MNLALGFSKNEPSPVLYARGTVRARILFEDAPYFAAPFLPSFFRASS
jgi:hypothetical protein